jgi:hypothetical protein
MKALCLLVAVGAAACSSHQPSQANADEYFYDCEDPKRPAGLTIYATDEAYRNFSDTVLATGYKPNDAASAQIITPAPDATLSLAVPPTFSFTAGMMARSMPSNAPLPPRRPTLWQQFRQALTFERKAWAHCEAVNGTLYLIELQASRGEAPVYSALSSVLSFTPGAEVWKNKLGALSGQKVSLTLARGVFVKGQLMLGPFVATKDVSFTIGP